MDESNSSNDKGNNGPGNNDNDPTQGNQKNENQNVAEPTGDKSLSDDTSRESVNQVRTTVSPVRRISFTSSPQTGSSMIRSLLTGSKRPSTSTEGHPGPAKAPQKGLASTFSPRCSSMSQPGPSSMSQPGPSSMSQPGPSSMSQPGPSSMSQPGPSSMSQQGPSSMSQPGPSSLSQIEQETKRRLVRTRSSYLKPGWNVESVEEHEVEERGRNALHILCSLRKHKKPNWKIQKLLDRKFSPNTPDKEGKTPVHLVIMSENFEALDILMKFGGDINVLDKEGWPPFFHIGYCINMVHVIRYNPDLNIRNRIGNTIFQHLCNTNIYNITPFLMFTKYNVDFGNVNNNGENCLHIITRNNNFAIHIWYEENPKIKLITLLIQKGANVKQKNSNLETPLHLAVVYDPDFVTPFLHAGAKLDVVDKNNLTPFDIAINNKGKSYLALREIIRYIVFRKHRCLPIKRRNMDLINSNEELRNIFEELEGLMLQLKNIKIILSSPTTCYDIISSTKNELLQILNNSEINEMLGYMGKLLWRNQYKEEILMVIEEGKYLKDEQLAIDILTEYLGRRLPSLCIAKIVSFLSSEDIKILINKNKNPNQ